MSAEDTRPVGYELLERASGAALPDAGVLSRTLVRDDGVRVTWFGFAAGEELTEHTSSRPALLHFLRGRARLTLGADTVEVGPGDHLRMEAGLRHSVVALEPLELVLTLLPVGETA
jgi:quercetin dioxygenase-like cupin family protein